MHDICKKLVVISQIWLLFFFALAFSSFNHQNHLSLWQDTNEHLKSALLAIQGNRFLIHSMLPPEKLVVISQIWLLFSALAFSSFNHQNHLCL